MAGLAAAVADFTVSVTTDPDQLALADRVARLFADTVAVAVAGRRAPSSSALERAIGVIPDGPCRVIGSATRTDMRTAALLNAFAAHALDFDDVSEVAYTHPSAVIVPVISAVADAHVVTHGDAVEAYTIAFQVESALARAVPVRAAYSRGWHASGVLGPITAAVAASRLLGLDADQARHALGLAVASAGGTLANFGSMAKPLTVARAAADGLWAAVLAGTGVTAGEDTLGGRGGFLDMFAARDRAGLVADALDLPWALLEHGPDPKPYPACSAARCAIDAARLIGADPGHIASITVTTEPHGLDALVHTDPRSADEARFSLGTLVALALVDGEVTSVSFSAESLGRQIVKDLAARVQAQTDAVPPIGPSAWKDAYAVVAASDARGSTTSRRADAPQGAAWPWEDLHRKFDLCTAGHPDADAWRDAVTGLADERQWGSRFHLP